ncbi:hypothetical protein [Streptomyces pseudovenezuelae]
MTYLVFGKSTLKAAAYSDRWRRMLSLSPRPGMVRWVGLLTGQ